MNSTFGITLNNSNENSRIHEDTESRSFESFKFKEIIKCG
jgi:hypothetical protein